MLEVECGKVSMYANYNSNVKFLIWFVSFENVYEIMWPIRNVLKLACLEIRIEMFTNWNLKYFMLFHKICDKISV